MHCAKCSFQACRTGGKPPANCPMSKMSDLLDEAMKLYSNHKKDIARVAAKVEKEGYAIWPRIREFAEFCRALGVKRVGIAFCMGLTDVARHVVEYLERLGFEVFSVACKCGAIDKALILGEDVKMRPDDFEPMCNPIAQALILNKLNTEVNGVIGLCVGHDALFYMHSRAPVVTLVVKDRVTGHNPAAAIYAKNYFTKRLYDAKPS
ncbi:MAG: DUF1847 domain-containing protein [Candidatus Nezhaarchaeales archaeon]